MAKPLRFRVSREQWSEGRVRREILQPLQANIGAQSVSPQASIPSGYTSFRFEMTNGDLAVFAFTDETGYWMGNTETPRALWRADKHGWDEVPYPVSRWAQREFLDTLHDRAPWLAEYPHLSWFFLPVFMSKDGRHSTRRFFREHAAGFPDTDWRTAVDCIETLLRPGILDPYREVMAGKLGTSEHVDRTRMSAAISEFLAADLLSRAGYEVHPEIEVSTGHAIDFRASDATHTTLVEVTRPTNPRRRSASGAVAAIQETIETKTSGQLSEHGGGIVLFVDCSGFDDAQWEAILAHRPEVGHRPTVVYRVRPDGPTRGYRLGRVPLDLTDVITFET